MNTPLVKCNKCGTNNRIRPHSVNVRPICGRCGAALTQSRSDVEAAPASSANRSGFVVSLVLTVLLATIVCGILFTPTLLRRDFSHLRQEEDRQTEEVRTSFEEQLIAKRELREAETMAIEPEMLRRSASEHYNREFDGRKSYDKRFALSPREKAQLQMQAIRSDSTKSYNEAIERLAEMASPKGADIRIQESSRGIALHIEFEMSSMTHGEHGTQTKHLTVESLRKEVKSIISRVTNDIFQFCQDLEIASIHVGCSHLVKTEDSDGQEGEELTLLYKTRIQKSRLQDQVNNPFLDIYSTSDYLEVEEDNFDNIEIVTTQL